MSSTHPLGMLAATVAAVALGACRSNPTAGTPCRITDAPTCSGTRRALVCDSSTWGLVACSGPRGCLRRDGRDECDDSVANAGDRCAPGVAPAYACALDRANALTCRDGSFVLWRHCRGPNACTITEPRHVDCDTTLGEPTDPCEKENSYACSVDRKAMLRCNAGALVVASSCRGPGGCAFDRLGHKVDCDDAAALQGDPCDRPGRIACGVDGKSELVCEGRTYVKRRDCRRSDCRVDGAELFCD
ncbi:MAG: hypothetical protein ABSC94_09105 [Polyangiaceae bacterium]